MTWENRAGPKLAHLTEPKPQQVAVALRPMSQKAAVGMQANQVTMPNPTPAMMVRKIMTLQRIRVPSPSRTRRYCIKRASLMKVLDIG